MLQSEPDIKAEKAKHLALQDYLQATTFTLRLFLFANAHEKFVELNLKICWY